MSTVEEWKRIKGFPNYEVSNLGNVRNDEGRLLSSHHPERASGYCKVTMAIAEGKYNSRTVHRIVAEAFIPNPENKPQIHHKNGDKADNRADNLEWVTPKEHGAYTAKPKTETAYFKNREARLKMSF